MRDRSPTSVLAQNQNAGAKTISIHTSSVASNLVARGRSLYEVMTLLGHSDYEMTTRYAHLAPGHLQEAVEVLQSAAKAAHP